MSERVDINSLLSSMRLLKAQSQAFGDTTKSIQEGAAVSGTQNFNSLFSQAINKVNEVQQSSSNMASAYIQGDESVDITDVMIASQKSSVAFQAATQVRNKVIEAYKDIMNMPI